MELRPKARRSRGSGATRSEARSPRRKKTAPSAGDTERMIIRTADLSIVVTDAAQAQKAVVDMVNGMGGYIADSNAWREGEQLRARMTVRVPAEKLDAAAGCDEGAGRACAAGERQG